MVRRTLGPQRVPGLRDNLRQQPYHQMRNWVLIEAHIVWRIEDSEASPGVIDFSCKLYSCSETCRGARRTAQLSVQTVEPSEAPTSQTLTTSHCDHRSYVNRWPSHVPSMDSTAFLPTRVSIFAPYSIAVGISISIGADCPCSSC
jgi:hypothetical protein